MSVVHHIAISADDLDVAASIYRPMFEALGGRAGHDSERLKMWHFEDLELLVYKSESPEGPHAFGTAGWQHVALAVGSRTVVDECARAVQDAGANIVHAPREYPEYWTGYYAVFFEDRDGIRWEVVYPAAGPAAEAH